MKKIQRWMLALALVFLSLPAYADGEWVFTDPPVISTADGSLVRNPSASIRGDWRQPRTLQGVSTSLPDRLPGMGSRVEMLNYIVASNRLGMNIWVSLVVYQPETERFELSTGKWSDGFASYDSFLADAKIGLEHVLSRYRTNLVIPDRTVYATLYVTYFNDRPIDSKVQGNGMALLVANPVSRFDSLSIDKIMGALEPNDNISIAQVIIPVTRLESINVRVDVGTGIAELDWTASTGAILSSTWRQYSTKEWTTPTYLYVRDWMAEGKFPLRIAIKASNGNRSTFTQFGDNLVNIELQMVPGALHVLRPRGASVDLQWSGDLQVWSPLKTITLGSEPTVIPLTQPLGRMMFFRGGEAF